jgi:hypothetical protein
MPKIEFGFDQYNSNSRSLFYPKSAKEFVPEWYKSLNKSIQLKKCMPFLDGMLSGYIAELIRDVDVKLINGEPITVDLSLVNYRPGSSTGFMSVPHGHHDKHFVWQSPYILKTDPGYSVLITHPFNRFDLPFTTMSAVCDADGIVPSGNVPFFLKQGFEGTIKAGTPIFQILPFKREIWESHNSQELVEENVQRDARFDRSNENFYRDTYWKKKEYK